MGKYWGAQKPVSNKGINLASKSGFVDILLSSDTNPVIQTKNDIIYIKNKSLNRSVNKYGKYIEELEKNVAQLKAESHPPVFTKKQHQNILKRLNNLEKGDTNEWMDS